MIIYGLLTAPSVLAMKADLCATCGVAGPHAIVRRTRWIEIFFLPIAPVWISHLLTCGNCGAETKLGFGQVRRALREGRLARPPRANFQAYADALYDANERRPAESEFDPIQRNPKPGAWNNLLKAWPAIAIVAILAVAFVPKLTASAPLPTLTPSVHDCWLAADGSVAGCRMFDGTLVGETSETQTVCFFPEPVPTGDFTFRCRD